MTYHPSPATFPSTWRDFQAALYRPPSREGDDFNAWYWVYRLSAAVLHDMTGSIRKWILNHTFLLALSLMVLVQLSYWTGLRRAIVQERWCLASATSCTWLAAHDFLVIYLSIQSVWHYVAASWSLPGYVPFRPEKAINNQRLRKAYEERIRRILPQQSKQPHDRASVLYIPCPEYSTCSSCLHSHERPPRSHHCQHVRRCVLQYDHFCVWIQRPVGANNLHSFLCLLLFLTLSCNYGMMMLLKPFVEIVHERSTAVADIREGSITWQQVPQLLWKRVVTHFTQTTGVLHLPHPWMLLKVLLNPWIPEQQQGERDSFLVLVVYAVIAPVGALLTIFFAQHIKLVCTARTTLDWKQEQEQQDQIPVWTQLQRRMWSDRLVDDNATDNKAVVQIVENPFDQGSWWKNAQHMMGLENTPLWHVVVTTFLPIPGLLLHQHSDEKME